MFSLVLISESYAQQDAYLIGDDIAVFYPNNYNAPSHTPSIALLEEPTKLGEIPDDWNIDVHFTEALGKRIVEISTIGSPDFYGTGEVTGSLIRNGTTRKIWNRNSFSYLKERGNNLYQSHPWVLGVRSDGSAFGVLADNIWKMEVTLGETIEFNSESEAYRIIVIRRDTPQEVMQALGQLTGTIELPPLWSLGYQQSRWSYYPDTRVKEIADSLRLKQIPCDVIWMDIHYMDEYRVFTFSPEHFPNPTETNNYLHNKGFKSVWMIDPGVKLDAGYSVYDSGSEVDAWVKTNNGDDYVGDVWAGPSVFPDFTQPKVTEWWGDLYKDFMATGIDGVWNDMNEPTIFSEETNSMPLDNQHKGGGELPEGYHKRYHNIYGMLMAKASLEGIKEVNPDKRPFVLTRSNHLGGQRYAATWNGDNASSWEHLKMSVPMSINLGLSGQPFNGPDIGGFAGNATPELYGHWIALGAFYPFSRAHSIRYSKGHEPWSFGTDIEDVARTALQRRYRLIPYLYTQFYKASTTGMPIMQPAFFAEPDNYDLRNEQEAFLLGSDLLIIPKWAENVTLPKGDWRSISIVGEDSGNDTYQPDIRIRPGAIIPLGNIIQNTTEYSLDTLTLYISLSDENTAEGSLYHDAGEGYGYSNGEYVILNFTAKASEKDVHVNISSISGNYSFQNSIVQVKLITDAGVFEAEGKWTEEIVVHTK
ncbi:TIM-barrel domain-containing protein [Winogradskyella forsetii]|nr:TIM-barrel domain-containing protein [Winogradskyella forsetii]